MGLRLRHVVLTSAVLSMGTFVYMVGFAPIDAEENPRALALNQSPSRGQLINLVRQAMATRQLTGADRASNTLLSHFSDDPSAYLYRAIVEEMKGDEESALAHWRVLDSMMASLTAWPGEYTQQQLAYLRAWGKHGIGEVEESQKQFGLMADKLEARAAQASPVGGEIVDTGVLYNLACYRSMSGELEVAIGHWYRAVELGYGRDELDDGGWWQVDPDLRPLHNDDRFWEVEANLAGSR